MTHSRWTAFRNSWFGLCGGVYIGLLIGMQIDRPGKQWFISTLAPALLFIAYIPDLAMKFLRGIRRYRSLVRR